LHFVPAGVFRERVVTEQALVQIGRGNKWNDHAYAGQPQWKGDQPNRYKDSKRDQGVKQAAYKTAPVLTFQLRIIAACHQANQGRHCKKGRNYQRGHKNQGHEQNQMCNCLNPVRDPPWFHAFQPGLNADCGQAACDPSRESAPERNTQD
jgi:hypothetical protein